MELVGAILLVECHEDGLFYDSTIEYVNILIKFLLCFLNTSHTSALIAVTLARSSLSSLSKCTISSLIALYSTVVFTADSTGFVEGAEGVGFTSTLAGCSAAAAWKLPT